MYDMTVYGLHSLTGILGPARAVTGFSGVGVTEREYRGQVYACDAHDNTVLLLDFGDNLFAFVYGTVTGTVTHFGLASLFGTRGQVEGDALNGLPLEYPGRDRAAASPIGDNALLPHVTGQHAAMGEAHVFEDIMQLVDWILDGTPSRVTPEHARHVIEIIEAGYRAAETGETQVLRTTFEPVDGE